MIAPGKAHIIASALAVILASAAIAADMALVPVSSTGPHALTGDEMLLAPGAQRVTLEVRVSNWDPDHDGDPRVKIFQAVIDASGYTSGSSGTLSLALIPCITDSDCRYGLECGTQIPGFCDVEPSRNSAAFIDVLRPDFVFAGLVAATPTDVSTPNVRYGGSLVHADDSILDQGVDRYISTLILDVPADATGTFTVGFFGMEEDSFLMNAQYAPIRPLVGHPGIITIEPTECGNGICELGENMSNCPEDCADTIPTTSMWGLAVMTLLLVAGAKIGFRRKDHPFAA